MGVSEAKQQKECLWIRESEELVRDFPLNVE